MGFVYIYTLHCTFGNTLQLRGSTSQGKAKTRRGFEKKTRRGWKTIMLREESRHRCLCLYQMCWWLLREDPILYELRSFYGIPWHANRWSACEKSRRIIIRMMAHLSFGSQRPSLCSKNRGTCFAPLSSIFLRCSRCASSTADFACVAASISFCEMATVRCCHSLHDVSSEFVSWIGPGVFGEINKRTAVIR